MTQRGFGGFWRRRWSREEALGLHLTLGLLACLVLVAAFALLGRTVLRQSRLVAFDDHLGRRLAENRAEDPAVRQLFLAITWAGSPPVLATLAVGGALGLLLARRRLLASVWLLGLAGSGLLDASLKLLYVRDRPPFRDQAIEETTFSFPSGHSLGSLTAYGLLAYLLMRTVGWPGWRIVIAVTAAVLILAIGFSRIYLGAHYASDVLGGYILGSAWLTACVVALETAGRIRRKEKP
jgi:membrane-associated phospholipid phosphatase